MKLFLFFHVVAYKTWICLDNVTFLYLTVICEMWLSPNKHKESRKTTYIKPEPTHQRTKVKERET
jgi:hypothetical protein